MKRYWLVYVLGVALVVLLVYGGINKEPCGIYPSEIPSSYIETPLHTIHIYSAETDCERQIGLDNFTHLSDDQGMLFVFPQDGRYGFWMKGMSMSIDILWLSAAGEVLHIVPELEPDTYPTTYTSPVPARYVLELASGASERLDIHRGDTLVLAPKE